MWFNAFISRGLIPDFLLRRGVRSQGKQSLRMMENSDLEKEYQVFLREASSAVPIADPFESALTTARENASSIWMFI